MGGPMAARIIAAQIPTTLWARRPEALAPFLDAGAVAAGSLQELAASSDYVGVCVVNDDDVRSVVLGDEGLLSGMAAGSVLAIHSTVHPETCHELARAAAAQGVLVIDAPVSGGGPRAAAGELLVLVGGDDAALDEVRPVLATFGAHIVHVGPLGAGQVAKIVNNTLMTAHLGTAQAAAHAGQALGLDPAALLESISHGSGTSFSLEVLRGHPEGLASFPAGPLLRKDVDLFEDLIASQGADPGLLGDVAEWALGMMGSPRGSKGA
jgi:3-hydroxyisobutyrate dehydrogenase